MVECEKILGGRVAANLRIGRSTGAARKRKPATAATKCRECAAAAAAVRSQTRHMPRRKERRATCWPAIFMEQV